MTHSPLVLTFACGTGRVSSQARRKRVQEIMVRETAGQHHLNPFFRCPSLRHNFLIFHAPHFFFFPFFWLQLYFSIPLSCQHHCALGVPIGGATRCVHARARLCVGVQVFAAPSFASALCAKRKGRIEALARKRKSILKRERKEKKIKQKRGWQGSLHCAIPS